MPRKQSEEVFLSIVVPAYNEEKRLPLTLAKLADYVDKRNWKAVEVVVVDDGSSDRTKDCVTEFMRHYSWLKLVTYGANRGKGAAVREGMLHATGEWRLLTDSDLSAPIEEVEKLFRVAQERNSQIVIASRALDRSLIGRHQSFSRECAGRFFNVLVRMLTGLRLFDTQCGFKLFSAQAAMSVFPLQRLEGFGFDAEVLFLGTRAGFSVEEVPTRWDHVDGTKVSMFGDSVRMFLDLLRIRYNWLSGAYSCGSAASIQQKFKKSEAGDIRF